MPKNRKASIYILLLVHIAGLSLGVLLLKTKDNHVIFCDEYEAKLKEISYSVSDKK